MAIDSGITDFIYIGKDPTNEAEGELRFGPDRVKFILPREKKKRSYIAEYEVEWSEVISFECCPVFYFKDDMTWPINEDHPYDNEPLGKAGMLFIFLRRRDGAFFQVWGYFPHNDVTKVKDLISQYLERSSVPGLGHHATAAPVRYILDHCEILEKYQAHWHDWLHTRTTVKPRKNFREKGPNYVFCEEGMAIDFYGAGEQLEQMSTFWPWRVMNDIFTTGSEIFYQWFEDAYTFRQQVWDDNERKQIVTSAKNALQTYNSTDDVKEFVLIRPWSFPSRFHRTWDKLEPFASKVSRNSFPPIYDFEEDDGSLI